MAEAKAKSSSSGGDPAAVLDQVLADLRDRYGDDRTNEDRLGQIEFHLSTAKMAAGHLAEEHQRRADERSERIARIERGEE